MDRPFSFRNFAASWLKRLNEISACTGRSVMLCASFSEPRLLTIRPSGLISRSAVKNCSSSPHSRRIVVRGVVTTTRALPFA